MAIARINPLTYYATTDVYSTTIIWSTVELGVGIFCACLPVMRPIVTACAAHIPRVDRKCSQPWFTDASPKQSRGTSFHLKPYGRGSNRLTKVEDEVSFAAAPQMEANATRHDSFGKDRDLEGGYGGDGIAVTTKIEQEFKDMSIG